MRRSDSKLFLIKHLGRYIRDAFLFSQISQQISIVTRVEIHTHHHYFLQTDGI